MTCRIMLKQEKCIEPPCPEGIVYPVCVKVKDKDAENNPCEYGSPFLDEKRKPINCSQVDKTCPHGSVCEQDPEIGWSLCCSRCYNPGSCVEVEEKPDRPELCKEDCVLDGDCGAIKKCCFNGCGQVCTDPIL
ncbi:hypothetical protein LOTGIDRAFT_228395 [Lottia gigantea]|uniref:WAP domain-containing protein n=1 Tax=Lottia gigantea TaxID=225164 RepID=V4ASP3_LOTGI|nr:hypothetical protein LOTGIDRAFT_228395 [Lottia gigantea]ESO97855.1 hypothetical protein LOTGIDRAFT_228395 [Lottia gigantea]